jgi:hypothetical protein
MIRPIATQAVFMTPSGPHTEWIKAYSEEDAVCKGEQIALSHGWMLESLELVGSPTSLTRCNRCEGSGYASNSQSCRRCRGRGYRQVQPVHL